MSNADLHTAMKRAADEFYTAYEDIAAEIAYYPKSEFFEKRVFCPCDDYEKSQIYRFFKENFHELGLNALVAQSIEPARWVLYDGTKEYVHNIEDGDFRGKSAHILYIMCDVIVTNPPFSLFREFMRTIMQHNKKFIVLGNVNAITYKEIMPGLVRRELFLGMSIRKGDREFLVPDEYPLEGTACRYYEGKKYIRVKGVRWFTNIQSEIDSDSAYCLEQSYSADKYEKFDTYDAINVNTTAEIPYDYDGEMGVPITALDKSGKSGLMRFQNLRGESVVFELKGMLNSGNKPEEFDFAKPIINRKCKFKRILIQKKSEN